MTGVLSPFKSLRAKRPAVCGFHEEAARLKVAFFSLFSPQTMSQILTAEDSVSEPQREMLSF
jgi:hypothetical protein